MKNKTTKAFSVFILYVYALMIDLLIASGLEAENHRVETYFENSNEYIILFLIFFIPVIVTISIQYLIFIKEIISMRQSIIFSINGLSVIFIGLILLDYIIDITKNDEFLSALTISLVSLLWALLWSNLERIRSSI